MLTYAEICSCEKWDDKINECFGRYAFRLADANLQFVPPPRLQPPAGTLTYADVCWSMLPMLAYAGLC
jgi:hypothetical protein